MLYPRVTVYNQAVSKWRMLWHCPQDMIFISISNKKQTKLRCFAQILKLVNSAETTKWNGDHKSETIFKEISVVFAMVNLTASCLLSVWQLGDSHSILDTKMTGSHCSENNIRTLWMRLSSEQYMHWGDKSNSGNAKRISYFSYFKGKILAIRSLLKEEAEILTITSKQILARNTSLRLPFSERANNLFLLFLIWFKFEYNSSSQLLNFHKQNVYLFQYLQIDWKASDLGLYRHPTAGKI